jgi:peptidyl-prolyl cis-trans isomerase SurA
MVRSIKILALGMAAVLAAGVCGAASGSVVVDRVVAVVNDEIITMSDLQREQLKRGAGQDERVVLEDMIDRKLQMVAAKRNGLDATEREVNEAVADIMKRNNLDKAQFEAALAREGLTFEQYRVELREQMALSRLASKYVRTGVAVEEAEVRTYYDRNPAQFSLPQELRVRHLVVKVPAGATPEQVAGAQARAGALMARLQAGEDFVRLIREAGEGPTAAQDGDLGFLQLGQAIPEIDEAAKRLKPGEYAGPLRTEDGFQIIRLEEVRTPVRPFEKVKEEITRLLFEQKMENTYRTFLQSLRSESHIENRL